MAFCLKKTKRVMKNSYDKRLSTVQMPCNRVNCKLSSVVSLLIVGSAREASFLGASAKPLFTAPLVSKACFLATERRSKKNRRGKREAARFALLRRPYIMCDAK